MVHLVAQGGRIRMRSRARSTDPSAACAATSAGSRAAGWLRWAPEWLPSGPAARRPPARSARQPTARGGQEPAPDRDHGRRVREGDPQATPSVGLASGQAGADRAADPPGGCGPKAVRIPAPTDEAAERLGPAADPKLSGSPAPTEAAEHPGPATDPNLSGPPATVAEAPEPAGSAADPNLSGSPALADDQPLVFTTDRDPADRWFDRLLTKLGLLDDAGEALGGARWIGDAAPHDRRERADA